MEWPSLCAGIAGITRLTRPLPGGQWSLALLLFLVSSIAGVAWAWSQRASSAASARLMFPGVFSELQFPSQDRTLDPAQEMAGEFSFWREPTQWVKTSILSREATDFVCRRIEKVHKDSPRLLRTAVLLAENGGLWVEEVTGASVQIHVAADTGEDAILLCQEYLNYLTAERDKVAMRRFLLEEKGLDQLQMRVDTELAVTELDLIRSLWSIAGEEKSKQPSLEQLTSDFGVYKTLAGEYRKLRAREVWGRLRAKCYSPDFVVLDAPSVESRLPELRRGALGGASVGLVLALLVLVLGGPRRKKARR